MLTFLKNHPFAVEAFFESSLVVTYAIPEEELQSLIPSCLTLDTFNEKWAFVAVALVKTKGLRPKGFPAFMGNDFVLTGYRIFVKYKTSQGKNLRGLYILKSETDKKKMEYLGNIFTHYQYFTTDISFIENDSNIKIYSKKSKFNLEVDFKESEVCLPLNSPFLNWKEARRFAGPLPFTFTFNEKKNEVLIIEGVRENWIPKPVTVIKNEIGFIQENGFNNAVLANAFIIQNIPYYWKKGRIDVWKT